jgi:tetratricopeptide (TPR) repeat protein
MGQKKELYEEAAREENEWVRAVILTQNHPAQEDALEIATRARDMAGRALGKTHPSYAEAVQNIGVYYSTLGNDPKKAAEYFDQARRVVGPYHPVLIRSFYFLGKYHHESGNADEAERFLNEVLGILRREGYAYDPRIAEVLTMLADIKSAAGEAHEASAYLEEALVIGKATLEADDPELKKTEEKLQAMQKR